MIFAACAAHAQTKLKIDFGSPGAREVWTADSLTAPPKDVQSSSAAVFEFLPSSTSGKLLLVRDDATGNLAVSNRTGDWKPTAADFKFIGKLKVRVEHAGQPVYAASVTLTNGGEKRTAIVDPGVKGEVSFYGLRPGPTTIETQYSFEARTKSAPKQTLDLSLKRSDPIPKVVVSIPDMVMTLEPEAPAKPSAQEKAEPSPAAGISGPGFYILYIAGIAAAIAAAYGILRYVQRNQAMVEDKLSKLGVKLPDPQQDDPVVVAPSKPEPQQQIILGDSGTDPVAPIAIGRPKLVGPSTIEIQDGASIVSREPGGIHVDDATVSRQHAKIEFENGSVVLTDLNSTNGTFVNGHRIDVPTPLSSGDLVQFGQVSFRFEG